MQADGHAECRDTSRLFPGSLAKWSGQKTALADFGFVCSCGEACGGYCEIRRGLGRAKMNALLEYCEQDCAALLAAWRRDVPRLAECGFDVVDHRGRPRLTFGSVAWHTAARMAGVPANEKPEWEEYDAGRAAYYGGRCEVGQVSAPTGRRYDIHSAYPWALTMDVPVGESVELDSTAAKRALVAGQYGSYQARVSVPESELPPLPHRAASAHKLGRLHKGRLVWSTGVVDGAWTHVELEHAQSHGAKILRVEGARVWSASAPLYAPYVEHAYEHRRIAREAGDTAWASLMKFLANSLSGKLAQRCDVSELVVTPERPDETWDWLGGNVYARKKRKLGGNMRPIQAAYLTSRVRATLHDRLARHEGAWLYCDTDSTYLRGGDASGVHESELGAWGDEGPMSEWSALGPKLYRYVDESGRRVVRAKGVPEATWEDFDALANRETVIKRRGVERIRSSGGAFERRVIERTNRAPEGFAGTRAVLGSGRTRPLHRSLDGSYR
jgi:hypothetical protein